MEALIHPTLEQIIRTQQPTFRPHEQSRPEIERAAGAHPDLATFQFIGRSEQERDMYAVILGHGQRKVCLLAGAHADEPVGPQTLRILALEGIKQRERLSELFDRFTFVIVPHVNPDGEAANWSWIEKWPDPAAYLTDALREPPGRDVEFGYPGMRPENQAVARLMEAHAPLSMHASLHGMSAAEGGMLLIERHWIDRTAPLRHEYAAALRAAGLSLFDWDRQGDKGFQYIGPGFQSTPEGRAMRAHFQQRDDPHTADLFHLSSMEYARELSGDPLCLVTELPLFVLDSPPPEPRVPRAYLKLKQEIPELRRRLMRGESIDRELAGFGVRAFDLAQAIRLQLKALDLGLNLFAAKGG